MPGVLVGECAVFISCHVNVSVDQIVQHSLPAPQYHPMLEDEYQIFGVATIANRKKKDDEEDGRQTGVVLTELGYIKSSVDDIKRKQDKQDEQTINFLRELTEVKESAKQAHKRIDTLEERINGK